MTRHDEVAGIERRLRGGPKTNKRDHQEHLRNPPPAECQKGHDEYERGPDIAEEHAVVHADHRSQPPKLATGVFFCGHLLRFMRSPAKLRPVLDPKRPPHRRVRP